MQSNLVPQKRILSCSEYIDTTYEWTRGMRIGFNLVPYLNESFSAYPKGMEFSLDSRIRLKLYGAVNLVMKTISTIHYRLIIRVMVSLSVLGLIIIFEIRRWQAMMFSLSVPGMLCLI